MSGVLDNLRSKIEPHHGGAFQPEDPEAVRALEGALGVALPTSLVAILTRYGACGFSGVASVDSPQGQRLGIFTLFGADKIKKDRESHPDYSEKGLVPVADDEFNNRYVWQVDTGAVFFIDYSHGCGASTKIANSPEEFLDRISVEPWED